MVVRPSLSIEARDTIGIVCLGLVLRIGWMMLAGATYQPLLVGETSNAALALARTGTIADAFAPGQGPTAHLLPTMIFIGGGVYRLFDPYGAPANLLLAGWALFQTVAAFLLVRRLFVAIGAPSGGVRCGLILLCVLPILAPQETCDFRMWESALALCLATLNLICIVRTDTAVAPSWRRLAGFAALAGFTAFVSPAAGLAVDCCWALVALRRWPFRKIVGFGCLGAVALAALFVPWMLRNEAVLGTPILVRSNFGLEFALANHPAAVSPSDPDAALQTRFRSIHPLSNPTVLARMRADGGEAAYARRLGREAWRWASAHPTDFARLTLRHYREFYVPETWQLKLTNWRSFVQPRAVIMQILTISGMVALLVGLATRRRYFAILATYAVVVGLPYALVQPIPRYSYLLYPIQVYLAGWLFATVWSWARHARSATLPRIAAEVPFLTKPRTWIGGHPVFVRQMLSRRPGK